MDRIRFGVFDHIEHLPGVSLTQLYAERLTQLEALDEAGFFAYHLAEHHTPAVHSMAPSQNVFLSAAAQRTKRLRFGPGVYVLPLHHPLRLIEEVSMLDHLSNGRLEIRRRPRRRAGSLLLGAGRRRAGQRAPLRGSAGRPQSGARQRRADLRRRVLRLRSRADAAAALPAADAAVLVH